MKKNLIILATLLSAGTLSAGILPLENPGFENGKAGWTFASDDHGISEVRPEAAHSGKAGLQITDNDITKGSSVYSRWLPARAGMTYDVNFWGRILEGKGMSVYVRFYDAEKKQIGKGDEHLIGLPTKATDWTELSGQTIAPDGAAYIALWLHSYGGNTVVVHLDDFVINEGLPVAPTH